VNDAAITVRFWGVRAHIPVPGPETADFGGNTPCLEVRCGRHLLIFDSGTGIRLLGQQLVRSGSVDADLFYAHTQFDRICGLPFFAAAFNPKNTFRIWAGHLDGDETVKGVLTQLMTDPLFPVPITIMRAQLEFHDFRAGATLEPKPGVVVRTEGYNWTRPVTGYRVQYGGKSFCYLSDVKRDVEVNADAVLDLIRDADIVAFNAARDPSMEGMQADDGWRWGAELCQRAGAGTYVITNHRQGDDDLALHRLEKDAEALRPGSVVAREGTTLEA
jgi:phosphoribosyl 1,2-cyclic phosphodiesterase